MRQIVYEYRLWSLPLVHSLQLGISLANQQSRENPPKWACITGGFSSLFCLQKYTFFRSFVVWWVVCMLSCLRSSRKLLAMDYHEKNYKNFHSCFRLRRLHLGKIFMTASTYCITKSSSLLRNPSHVQFMILFFSSICIKHIVRELIQFCFAEMIKYMSCWRPNLK